MFDHVTVRAAGRAASERFYDLVLARLGVEKTYGGGLAEWDDFSVAEAGPARPATRRLHVGFVAPSQRAVDGFWEAGVRAGYADGGRPGPRPQYREDYYGAFLLDPDGNGVEAVHHGALRRGGNVDHLWLRVRDVDESARFWAAIAPPARLRTRRVTPDRLQVVGHTGSLSIVAGVPSEHVHVAFPAADDGAVRAFHAAAMAAGYRDHGAPGERPEYHDGYFAAFVLDPDGNNVELVSHNRGEERFRRARGEA